MLRSLVQVVMVVLALLYDGKFRLLFFASTVVGVRSVVVVAAGW